MKSGKIILMMSIVLASAIGLVALQELNIDENNNITINDFFSQSKTVTVKVSDGVDSKLSGFG